jgi:hypothetical protein
MSEMTTVSLLSMAQPLMHSDMTNLRPFHSGPTASSST